MTRVALVGNPNCGKTTLFNALTGTRQRVANWPGVTVERKSGEFAVDGTTLAIDDLPGTYSLSSDTDAIDEQIARAYLANTPPDLLINVVDVTSLTRGLYLSTEVATLGVPIIVVLNMSDVAARRGLTVDTDPIERALGAPVIKAVASRNDGVEALRAAIVSRLATEPPSSAAALPAPDAEPETRYAFIDQLVEASTHQGQERAPLADRLDNYLLNRYLAFPLFLVAMYLMFLFSINVGSAFIDWFDLMGAALFVEIPRALLNAVHAPDWLTALIADGVGGGMQLVATFIPVIGCLFLALSFLEDSGYMARVAFIVDRLLRSLGLPGKSFVPLIVGFGCNVPAVMATRSLDHQPDRILTTLMAPYMSCGARLTVYALFAVAFFPTNGHNVVFALYLLGIAVAVLSALAVRRHLLPESRSSFVMELPAYHLPTWRGLAIQTWQRLRGFVVRAGKAIVAVVVVLNVLNSAGTDGSFGNDNTEKSALSAVGQAITPLFAPIGITEANWPATVGIFTGIFAKEVVVGTLDALYSGGVSEEQTIGELVAAAFSSVPENLSGLAGQVTDPLGINLGDLSDEAGQAEAQSVRLTTIGKMRDLFTSPWSAFSYLVFILLYVPCVATVGVIHKELGGFWATFSVAWSLVAAYGTSVVVYQSSNLLSSPLQAGMWIAGVSAVSGLCFLALIRWGRRRTRLIPVVQVD